MKTQRLNTCELTAFFRAETTVRWPPKDGQPAPMLQETTARCCGFAGRQRTDGPRRRHGYDERIDEQAQGTESGCPAEQCQRDRNVHGIARVTVEPRFDQACWRRPRRKGSLSRDVEIAHTPQKSCEADCQKQQAQRLN